MVGVDGRKGRHRSVGWPAERIQLQFSFSEQGSGELHWADHCLSKGGENVYERGGQEAWRTAPSAVQNGRMSRTLQLRGAPGKDRLTNNTCALRVIE